MEKKEKDIDISFLFEIKLPGIKKLKKKIDEIKEELGVFYKNTFIQLDEFSKEIDNYIHKIEKLDLFKKEKNDIIKGEDFYQKYNSCSKYLKNKTNYLLKYFNDLDDLINVLIQEFQRKKKKK